MLRSFLPVGQGAFYLEQFKYGSEKINVVYDCGSLPDVKVVEKEIKNNFKEKEKIDIVFISHLHEDHVNGLEFLLTYCDVRNVVLPYIRKEDKHFLSIKYLCDAKGRSENDFTYRLINEPEIVLENARIIEVYENVDSIINEQKYNEQRFDQRIKREISGTNLIDYIEHNDYLKSIKWEYVPFNFRETERKKIFLEKLKMSFKNITKEFDENHTENILELWGDKET